MAKEIKVYKYADENDDYVELWKEVNGERFYGRYTYNDEGSWYYISDPLGYCELDSQVDDDITFVCCDINGNEHCRYSNKELYHLPKLETVIKTEWNKVKAKVKANAENLERNMWAEWWNGDTTMSINQWLISFMDPDMYAEEIKAMYGYAENWTSCWHTTEIGHEPIEGTEFFYLGKGYQFTKVHMKHDVCGVEWDEFWCTDSPIVVDDGSETGHKGKPWINTYLYCGNTFDKSKYGTMYDQRTARDKVIEALTVAYPKENEWSKLLMVSLGDRSKAWWSDTASELSYADVADALIHGDRHCTKVDELCENVKRDTIFISNRENKELIRQQYPDIYGYDSCLY